MSNLLDYVNEQYKQEAATVHPTFKAGDTITVHYNVKEGQKERIQRFQGVVIQRKGSGITESFTV